MLQYPDVPPLFELETHGVFSFAEEETIYDALTCLATERLGTQMVCASVCMCIYVCQG